MCILKSAKVIKKYIFGIIFRWQIIDKITILLFTSVQVLNEGLKVIFISVSVKV